MKSLLYFDKRLEVWKNKKLFIWIKNPYHSNESFSNGVNVKVIWGYTKGKKNHLNACFRITKISKRYNQYQVSTDLNRIVLEQILNLEPNPTDKIEISDRTRFHLRSLIIKGLFITHESQFMSHKLWLNILETVHVVKMGLTCIRFNMKYIR